MKWTYLIIGGIAGTLCRYLTAVWVPQFAGARFPYGTLLTNISGCFLIGLFAALAEEKFVIGPNGRMLLMTGFCGAFTTFSTYMLETTNLMRDGEWSLALVNFVASNLVAFIALRLGFMLGEII